VATENFGAIVDILASLASLVAIVVALIAWYRSARDPLRIERVVLHIKQNESTFILVVKNRKSYPVTIKSLSCYTKLLIEVRKNSNEPTEYQELLNLADRIFDSSNAFTIDANGHTDIRFDVSPVAGSYEKFLFSMHTSHGYHRLWCKNILEVQFGAGQMRQLDYRRDFESRTRARLFYYWAKFRENIRLPIRH